MRRRITVCGMLVLLLLPAAAGAGESFEQLEARWFQYRDGLQSLPRQERLEKARLFFVELDWADICYYCEETHAEADPSTSSSLAGLVEGMLRANRAEPEALAALLGNPDANSSCQKAIVQFFRGRIDSLRALPEASLYADALLRLADSGRRDPGISGQLERAAASLYTDDALMERMMAHARAEDEPSKVHGIEMLRASQGARASDSLRVLAGELVGVSRYRTALSKCLLAMSQGPDAARHFDFYLSLASRGEGSIGKGLLHDALGAMARSGDPRAYGPLLAAYGDSAGGIADSTSAITDRERRSFYWNLWHLTREAEPGMRRVFEEDGPGAVEAVELLDRASRFGLPRLRDELLRPFSQWGRRQGPELDARVEKIVERFGAYPDPISRTAKTKP